MVLDQKPKVLVTESRKNYLVRKAAEKFRFATYFRDLRWFTPEQDIIINQSTYVTHRDNQQSKNGNFKRGRVRRNFFGILFERFHYN